MCSFSLPASLGSPPGDERPIRGMATGIVDHSPGHPAAEAAPGRGLAGWLPRAGRGPPQRTLR
jgi:hypothetical protein